MMLCPQCLLSIDSILYDTIAIDKDSAEGYADYNPAMRI